MKISELPEDIKQKALLRQRECNDLSYDNRTDFLHYAFDFKKTPEGWNYWYKISEEIPQPDKLQTLIDWMEVRVQNQYNYIGITAFNELCEILNKAKEIQNNI